MDSVSVTIEEQAVIDDLLRGIDFEKIQGYMALTGWKYRDEEDRPSQKNLRKTAARLILDVMRGSDTNWVSCGGFYAEYHDYEYEPEIEIGFIVEERSIYWKKEKQ